MYYSDVIPGRFIIDIMYKIIKSVHSLLCILQKPVCPVVLVQNVLNSTCNIYQDEF